jgi:hypothetical protein
LAGTLFIKAKVGNQSICPSSRDEVRKVIVDAAIKQLKKAGFTQQRLPHIDGLKCSPSTDNPQLTADYRKTKSWPVTAETRGH